MANGDPTQTVIILVMVAVLAVVTVFELRLLRSRRKRRSSEQDLPDRAHNAILSAKAIAEALARGDVRSPEADDLIREADDAFRQRHHRVSVELAEKAKAVLRAEKQKYQAKGDLSKVEGAPTPESTEEDVTTKERLTKELPPNYAQSKFAMNLAQDEIDAAKTRGEDASEAERFLSEARGSFDGQDYEGALRQAVRARRALEVTAKPVAPPTPTPVPAPAAKGRTCASCGTPVAAGDAFCRKCGVAVPVPRTCPSCGAEAVQGDAFCRKCGTRNF